MMRSGHPWRMIDGLTELVTGEAQNDVPCRRRSLGLFLWLAQPFRPTGSGTRNGVDAMTPEEISARASRFARLQRYVGWSSEDAARMKRLLPLVEPAFDRLLEDFYVTVRTEAEAARVITGGPAQVERLKVTLREWLVELFSGQYDADYLARRWRVGWRHVEIGLDPVFANVALARLRHGLIAAICTNWDSAPEDLAAFLGALNKALDLDMTMIEDAYQTEYQRRQQRIERLITIGHVAGGVAHELRNPLNVIRTSVYFLRNAKSPAPAKVAEHLGRIERQVSLADAVITALSDFAKQPVPQFQPLDLEPFLRETLQEIELGPAIPWQLDCSGDVPQALADRRQLRIVVDNLVRNARDAMPTGGRLHVTITRRDSTVEVAVVDNGCGIKPEDLHRVTEPLFSTKARGMGLGLALVRAILDKHQGQLRVSSQLGQGSTFTIVLPAAPPTE